ncbi:MAG: hypothetical protein ACQER9_02240 [Nanobdellota archaeon]
MYHYLDSRYNKITSDDIREYDEIWKKLFHENGVPIPKGDEKKFNVCPNEYVVDYFRDAFMKFFCASEDIENNNSDYKSVGELFRDNFPFFFSRHSTIDQFIDLGCGNGWTVALASILGYRSIGVERSLEILTVGKEIFNDLQIDEKRLIEGDYLSESFWETTHLDVDPKSQAIFLLFQPEKYMEKGLRVTSRYMHREARIVTGIDYFSSTDTSVINDELLQFNLHAEASIFGKELVLKKM